MKVKKLAMKIAALAIAAVSAFGFAACGGGKARKEIESRTDKYGNTIVTIMVHKDQSTKEGTAYKKCVDDFNAEYKSQKIQAQISFVAQTEGVDQYETTITELYRKGEGKLYDIIAFDAPKCAGYASSGILYDITTAIGDYANEFIPTSINRYDNKIYGLPIQESSAGFYYNRKLMNDAGITDAEMEGYKTNGWTFEQFKSVCQRLKDKGLTPVDMQLGAGGETSTYLLYPFGNAAGGEYVSADGKTVTGYLDSAATKQGFQFIKDCLNAGYTNHDIGGTKFLSEKTVAMQLSSGWTIPLIEVQYISNFTDGWGILPYPHATGHDAVSAMGSWSFGITDNGVRNKDAAVELIKWMTSDASATTITNATGMIAAKNTLNNNYEATSPRGVLYNQLIHSGKQRPAMSAYAAFSTEFNLILRALKDSEVGSTLDSHTASLQTKISRIER